MFVSGFNSWRVSSILHLVLSPPPQSPLSSGVSSSFIIWTTCHLPLQLRFFRVSLKDPQQLSPSPPAVISQMIVHNLRLIHLSLFHLWFLVLFSSVLFGSSSLFKLWWMFALISSVLFVCQRSKQLWSPVPSSSLLFFFLLLHHCFTSS